MPEIEKWWILNHRNRTEKSYETVTNSVKPLSSPVYPRWCVLCILCVFVFWCIFYDFRSTARKKIKYRSIYTKMIDVLFPYKNLSSQCLEPSKTGDSGVCLDPVWFVGGRCPKPDQPKMPFGSPVSGESGGWSMLMLQLNPNETDITNDVKFTNITNITLRRASTHRVVREVVLCLAAKKNCWQRHWVHLVKFLDLTQWWPACRNPRFFGRQCTKNYRYIWYMIYCRN